MLSSALSPSHLLLLILVLVVLFGAKRLPEAARGLGRSARILKSEVSGLNEDNAKRPEPKAETKAETTAETKPGSETKTSPDV
jgi:sec-independent protein translocase protein TatA